MKLPRDINATELVKLLNKFGYTQSRQKGSHIRMTTLQNGKHSITVPNHSPVRTGTLNQIISDVASHFNKPKDEILASLFS
jgi:predicted RNA binding protein YcfA (HicA-like mRNA interferase family)